MFTKQKWINVRGKEKWERECNICRKIWRDQREKKDLLNFVGQNMQILPMLLSQTKITLFNNWSNTPRLTSDEEGTLLIGCTNDLFCSHVRDALLMATSFLENLHGWHIFRGSGERSVQDTNFSGTDGVVSELDTSSTRYPLSLLIWQWERIVPEK